MTPVKVISAKAALREPKTEPKKAVVKKSPLLFSDDSDENDIFSITPKKATPAKVALKPRSISKAETSNADVSTLNNDMFKGRPKMSAARRKPTKYSNASRNNNNTSEDGN